MACLMQAHAEHDHDLLSSWLGWLNANATSK